MATSTPLLRPDTLLHIYYIEGELPADLTLPHPDFIGNWVEDGFSFLFFTSPAQDTVTALLDQDATNFTLLDSYEMTYLQWQGGQVEPIRIGRFLFNPPWIRASAEKDDISLTMDSGVVFGSGTHPTTQACLKAIEIACAGGKVSSMLDLGCGTGVLALAAAGLGVEKILAVDYNYLATRTTRRNVELNKMSDRILVVNGRAEQHTAVPCDLMVANIHYDVMKDLIKTPGFLDQKWFILSGLLTSEASAVAETLATLPVLVLKRWCQDDIWHTFLGITNTGNPASQTTPAT